MKPSELQGKSTDETSSADKAGSIYQANQSSLFFHAVKQHIDEAVKRIQAVIDMDEIFISNIKNLEKQQQEQHEIDAQLAQRWMAENVAYDEAWEEYALEEELEEKHHLQILQEESDKLMRTLHEDIQNNLSFLNNVIHELDTQIIALENIQKTEVDKLVDDAYQYIDELEIESFHHDGQEYDIKEYIKNYITISVLPLLLKKNNDDFIKQIEHGIQDAKSSFIKSIDPQSKKQHLYNSIEKDFSHVANQVCGKLKKLNHQQLDLMKVIRNSLTIYKEEVAVSTHERNALLKFQEDVKNKEKIIPKEDIQQKRAMINDLKTKLNNMKSPNNSPNKSNKPPKKNEDLIKKIKAQSAKLNSLKPLKQPHTEAQKKSIIFRK